jgi:hypothetical protein
MGTVGNGLEPDGEGERRTRRLAATGTARHWYPGRKPACDIGSRVVTEKRGQGEEPEADTAQGRRRHGADQDRYDELDQDRRDDDELERRQRRGRHSGQTWKPDH